MRTFAIARVAPILFLGGFASGTVADSPSTDHLVPVEEYFAQDYGSGGAYRKLWQKKLLVTPGDMARFVSLPGNVGEESAVSVYRDTGKKGGQPSGYWVTVTQASARLWDSIPAPDVKRPIDQRTITIDRCDLPLPESTALAIHNAWLAMLLQTRPEPKSESISLDSTTEIFFVTKSDGTVLSAQLPRRRPSGKNLALLNVANSLIEYCNTSASQRAAKADQIQKAASALLRQVKRR